MPVQQSDHSLIQKQLITFAAITLIGVATLLLGLALIIFAHYHERAYIFLGLGAGGFIGGIAGIVGTGSKSKTALSYGVISLGMMGLIVGLNYLTNNYGNSPNQTHGYIAIALSIIAILAGILGSLLSKPKGGIAVFFSVFMLGVIASTGIVALIVGTIYLIVLDYTGPAHLLLSAGAVCLIGGITCGIFAQSRGREAIKFVKPLVRRSK